MNATVFVVDDDASVREAVSSLLRSVGYDVAGFATTRDFLLAKRGPQPSCLVLDIRLPGASGLELQRELLALGSHPPIVFITGHGDIPMSVAAMKDGAVEFLTKPFREQDLLDAVHAALEIDRRQRAEGEAFAVIRQRWETLTPRERQVMAQVVAGRLNKQIAGDLGLSEVTVKVHRAAVMTKMQVAGLPDLVRAADRLANDAAIQRA
ncbi:response regulator transcription factor [Aurantimonas coralicida]|uniref:response regulator transcription factor n=1 Tax=Aurantimonas coralicida TaxID=182270 RepID=UPI001D1863B5|nr:response regulator transcription factor [Aurantimonas coralicida]MCC4300072.1 response regulator transcription factor [Aurantimonas coralicida]